jgi:hypothetical protein
VRTQHSKHNVFFVFIWLILCYRAIHFFVGPSSVASQQFASTGSFFIARVVPTIPATFSYMHENTQSLMLSEARRDFSAINVIAATYYTSFGRVDGMIPNTIVSRLPSSEFADELLSSGLLSPGGFFATYYGAPSFQLLSILASPRLVSIAPIINYITQTVAGETRCSNTSNHCGMQRNYASDLGISGTSEAKSVMSQDISWGVRFHGFIRPSRPGFQSYRLTLNCDTAVTNSCDADDRFRLWIDGALIINAWENSMTNLGLGSTTLVDPVPSTCNDAVCSQMSLQEIVLEYRSSLSRSMAKTRILQLEIDAMGSDSWSFVGNCSSNCNSSSLGYSGCCGYRLNDFHGSPVPVTRDRNFIGPSLESRN